MSVRAYYSLIKPGVTYGNALTAAAGFLLASERHIDFMLFIPLLLGITLVIGSACAFNNFLDQDIDKLMARTKTRALIAGKVSGKNAVIFASVLGILGFLILYIYTNLLTTTIVFLGFFVYVVLYGMLSKRLSIHGTLIGSISGAMPILAGYTAVTNDVDIGGIILFLILFFWQMPEFYSIAIYRRKEYKAAGIPVMTVVKGIENTKIQIFIYIIAFSITALSLSLFRYTGYIYLLVMTLLCLWWVWLSMQGFTTQQNNEWSRKVFRFSLIILVVFSALISVDAWLP